MTNRIKISHYAFNEGYNADLNYRGDAPEYGNPADQAEWLKGRRARLEKHLDDNTPRPLDELLSEEAAEKVVALTAAFEAADNVWQSLLASTFGKDAADARYEARGKGRPGSRLRDAYLAREAARVAAGF